MWQAIYDSPWHHPLACWLATAALLGWLIGAWRRVADFTRAWLIVFALLVTADAAVTGNWALVSNDSPLSRPLALGFTIAAEWLFFLLSEREAAGTRLGWLTSAGWAALVPVGHFLATQSWWQDTAGRFSHSADTALFWYELAFLGAALIYQNLWLRRRLRNRPQSRWLMRLAAFQVAMYAGFALADGLILAHVDWGYGLRVVPNLMYYVGFIWLVALTAVAVPAVAATESL